MLKRRWRDIVVIAVSTVAVVLTLIVYSFFTGTYIFEENSDHLLEIYGQVNQRFSQKVESYRGLMKSWTKYIENSMKIITDENSTPEEVAKRENEFLEFMLAQQEYWSFNNFYFISDKGNENGLADKGFENSVSCYSLFDKNGDDYGANVTLKFRRSLGELIKEDKGGVVGVRENGGEQFMLFAVRADGETTGDPKTYHYKGNYGEFDYFAIGISFTAEAMMNVLEIETFGDEGICFVALKDGNVLLQTSSNHAARNNLTEFLNKENAKVSYKSTDAIIKEWEDEKAGTALVYLKDSDEEYYLTYQPVGFAEWMFLGFVPSAAVDSGMSRFRLLTMLVMGAVFAAIAAVVAVMLIVSSKRKVKERELEIKSRENLLDLLTVNTSDIFILFSPESFVAEYVSANIYNVLGLDADEVRADVRNVLKAAVETHAPFTTAGLKALPVGKTWDTDIQMKHMGGDETYWFQLTLYHSVRNGKDSCVMMFSDRTKERKLNENLKDALEVAKSANEAKSNFLSNMSHDIRTPMNAILGFATLIAKDSDKPDKVREYIRKISFSGQHLLSLINDILDMSKIESGKTTLNIEEFSFPEFLEELYSIIVPQSNAQKHSFDVYTKGHLPERVFGDRMRLNQILLNLLSNAVKYTPEGGHIELTVEALEKTAHNHTHLRISVKDNGIGMSEQFVKEIFDPFAREINVHTKGIQGTGLGMAIAKNMVGLMGGVLSVESELGKGSVFTVEIELAIAAKHDEDDKEFWKHHNVTRILVVDDEEDICVGVRELMADTGVDVHYALSGKKAVEMVSDAFDSDEAYCIVLIDWKMPEMDGIETAKLIRKKVGNDVPIMVLTSYSFDEIEDEAKEAGITLFMPKPFFVSNFRNAIEKLRDGDEKELAAVPGKISLAGLKVLAAEDNEINAEILTDLLDIEGVTCEIAQNGQEAVDKFNASEPGRYDMIFMDVQMPVMNGYEATRAIRASKHPSAKSIPIIAMTANAFDDDVRQALDSGMNAHLAKPIDMEKLKKIIAELREDSDARQ